MIYEIIPIKLDRLRDVYFAHVEDATIEDWYAFSKDVVEIAEVKAFDRTGDFDPKANDEALLALALRKGTDGQRGS